jgi:hypothetical protein
MLINVGKNHRNVSIICRKVLNLIDRNKDVDLSSCLAKYPYLDINGYYLIAI